MTAAADAAGEAIKDPRTNMSRAPRTNSVPVTCVKVRNIEYYCIFFCPVAFSSLACQKLQTL